MTEFLAALAGSVAGGLLALVGAYLASRWQAKHQRSNLLHEARIALYVDLIADCRYLEVWLTAACGSHSDSTKVGERYRPAVPLNARIELLAPDRSWIAWALLMDANDRLMAAIENDGWPINEHDSLSRRMPEVEAVRDGIEAVRVAVRRDLTKG